ncbi:MAG TPA: NUDIX hydrolase [Stellaceae bacterium]|nr:NUDIX hydrolase [Stellaceae bacterium]
MAYRLTKNGEVRILLVSKKRSKQWGIPKGRLTPDLTYGQTAAKETYEEAGVRGRISTHSVGSFRSMKRLPQQGRECVIEVWVYLLEVTERLADWPEKGRRDVRWVSCKEAARQLREPKLSDLCLRLKQELKALSRAPGKGG